MLPERVRSAAGILACTWNPVLSSELQLSKIDFKCIAAALRELQTVSALLLSTEVQGLRAF
jgi:hypothetical protein